MFASRARATARALLWLGSFVACGAPPEPIVSGFLGDYASLAPAEDVEGAFVYIDPRADFAPFDEIAVEPVTVWARKQAPGPRRQDLQRLADCLEAALRRQLAQEFAIVERAGPRTLRLRAAIAEEMGADVFTGVASEVPPRSVGPSDAEPLPPETRVFVEEAALEVEALAAWSNRRLVAAVDLRGVPAVLEHGTESWGDVEQAMDDWADGVQAALAAFHRNARAEQPGDSPTVP